MADRSLMSKAENVVDRVSRYAFQGRCWRLCTAVSRGKLFAGMALTTIIAMPASLLAGDDTATRLYESASHSVATIEAYLTRIDVVDKDITGTRFKQPAAFGSGVVVELTANTGPYKSHQPKRWVVTNCHVVNSGDEYRIRVDGKAYDSGMWEPFFLAADPERDLCALSVPNLEAPAVRRGDSAKLRVGQRVFTLGAPQGLQQTLSEGIISGFRESAGGRVIQTSAPISPGSSGGALLDDQGALIGITSFKAVGGENLNFAVPADWLNDLFDRHQAYIKNLKASEGLSTPCLVAIARRSYSEARDIARRWVTIDAYSASALSCLGQALSGLGNYREAIAVLTKAIELWPRPGEWIELASAYWAEAALQSGTGHGYSSELLANGEKAARSAVELDPESVRGWVTLADALSQAGKRGDALAAAETAVRIEPGNTSALLAVAVAQLDLGNSKIALESSRKCIAIDLKNEACWMVVEQAAGAEGDQRSADAARTMWHALMEQAK